MSRGKLTMAFPETIWVPARFNGPLTSGNGGYSCGAVAEFLESPAEVSLRAPVPLDTPLTVERGGDEVRVFDGATLVAEGAGAPGLSVEVPEPVTVDDASEASRHYTGPYEGPFSQCFVCGRTRKDSLGVFAGRVEGREVVASPWVPPAWASDEDGRVRSELVWAVLDCPATFAAYMHDEGPLPVSFLARMGTRIEEPVPTGEEHVVMAWSLEADGRKRHSGSALLSSDGQVLAAARALLIEPR